MKPSLFLIFSLFFLLLTRSVFAQTVYVPTVCDANINSPVDNIVDLSDYSILVGDFFKRTDQGTPPSNPRSDINKDKIVDISDYSALVQFFFQTCVVVPTATPENQNEVVIQAEDYVAYTDSTPDSNIGGAYRQDGVDIKTIPGGYAVGWMATGETLEYDLTITQSGNYGVKVKASTEITDPVMKVEVVGQWSKILTLPKTISYADFQEFPVAGGQLAAGTYRVKLTVDKQWFDLDSITFVKDLAPITTSTIAPINTLTPSPTVTPSSQIPAGAIILNPGDNIQSAVNAQPAGKTYYLKAGTYRMQKVTPKTGDTYIGEKGAVLNGSKILTSFTQDGSRWKVTGQTQEGYSNPGEVSEGKPERCRNDYRRCYITEELFINDVRQRHANTIAEVTEGRWYFDRDSDTMYIGTNPVGKTVETTVTDCASVTNGNNPNVTIKNLEIQKYANPAQRGAINSKNPITGGEDIGTGWVVEYNNIHNNHGPAVTFGDRNIVRNNIMSYNGQLGINGGGVGAVVENNDIGFNNQAGFDPPWESGASKFAVTTDLVVRNNYVHDSVLGGRGLWTDIDNRNTLYENNIVVRNESQGIKHEISYDAIIRNNYVAYNGAPELTWIWGSQIFVQISQNVEVYGNTVVFNSIGDGIGISGQLRNSQFTENVNVHDNYVYKTQPGGHAFGFAGDDPAQMAGASIRVQGNKYYLPSLTSAESFEWPEPIIKGGIFYNWASWQASGRDTTGTAQLINTVSVPAQPAWNVAVGPQ